MPQRLVLELLLVKQCLEQQGKYFFILLNAWNRPLVPILLILRIT